MARSRLTLIVVERFAAAACVLLGWLTVVDQLIHDGLASGGGTLWLAAFAVVATVGALTVFAAYRPQQHGLRGLGLALTALSPTVFAYILNTAVLGLAVTEFVRTVALKRRPRHTITSRK